MSETIGTRLLDLLTAGEDAALFGVPGGQTLPLYGASARAGTGVRHVLVRDERNAACAADGFARVTGRVGICDATVGPGATNLVSGLAEAYASSIPIVAIVADIRRDVEHLRRRGVVSQAIEQAALLAPVTKWVGRVHEPDALDEIVDHALRIATTGRPGPVAIEIPEDIFLGEVSDPRARQIGPQDRRFPRFRPYPDPDVMTEVAEMIAAAERPVIVAGGGVAYTGAAAAVAELAERHGLPVVTTVNGKGAIGERHPLSAGVVGGFGTLRGSQVVHAADLVIAIGTKFDQLSSHAWRLPGVGQKVIHADVDGEEIGRAIPVTLGVLADARSFAVALHAELGSWSAPGEPWIDQVVPARFEREGSAEATDGRVDPVDVIASIDELLGADDLLVCDASLSSGWAAAGYRVERPGIGMIAPRGLAGLGWAPGAALGARLGRTTGKVVVLAGDGAWGYAMGEVETAARLSLDITYVVLNNAALGWIRHAEAAMRLESRSTFTHVDFAAAASAMGVPGTTVGLGDDLTGMLSTALDKPGPTLVEVQSSATASPVIKFGSVRRSPYG